MKYILVPTDFSSAAKTAYNYALEVARAKSLPIRLVHCYLPDVDPAFPYLGINSKEFLDAKRELIEKFKQRTLPPHEGGVITSVAVETDIRPGYPTEEIVNMTRSEEVDMVIMGTTGEHGLAGKLFGSVSTHISRKAACPVLLVPKGVHFGGVKHILFASSYEAIHDNVLHHLKNLATLFGSSVHFVHVREPDDATDYTEVEERIFDFFFGEEDPVFAFNMDMVHAEDAVNGLNDYVKRREIDLTVMVSPRRSFWENMLHKSTTKAMALNTEVPMLVFHADEK